MDSRAPAARPHPDIEADLKTLRDPAAPAAARGAAWGGFVRWLHDEHYAPALQLRLRRRIEGQGMLTQFAPCDVFSSYCLRARENPNLLGVRSIPSRTWLRRQLDSICRELERRTRRRQRARRHPATAAEMSRLLEAAPVGVGGLAEDARQAGPEGAALWRDLQAEIRRELEVLHAEHPAQAKALALGAAGEPYAAIAAGLSTSTGTVKSLIHRARAKLRKRLAGYLDPAYDPTGGS